MQREENPFEDNKVAHEWIEWVESNTPDGDRLSQICPLVKDWLTTVNPKVVVDVGSGQGAMSEYVDSEKIEYIGVEPSTPLVGRAKELYERGNKKFVIGNVYALPIKDAWAEAAFSVYVWMHLKDLDKASQELARILNPGGNFLIITANPGAYSVWKSLYSDAVIEGNKIEGKVSLRRKTLSKNNIYLHSKGKIEKELLDSGLVINKIKTFGHGQEHGDEGLHIYIEGTKAS